MPRILVPLAAIIVLASCGSMQQASDEGSAAYVARLVNDGKAADLAAMSASPFLLDGEIIPLAGDVALFWDGVAKAGLRLDTAPERALPVGAETWREFGSSREVEIWFKRYVQEGARLFELRTAGDARVLVLFRQAWFSRKLYGFKGPF